MTKRLSELEESFCRLMGVDAPRVNATTPRALIVGESSGRGGWVDCPLFPHPVGSTGERLWRISGLELQTYLETFQRINIVDENTTGTWDHKAANIRARTLVASVSVLQWPLILLGSRVARAFNVEHLAYYRQHIHTYAVLGRAVQPVILYKTHNPSRASQASSDPGTRSLIRSSLLEAAGLLPSQLSELN